MTIKCFKSFMFAGTWFRFFMFPGKWFCSIFFSKNMKWNYKKTEKNENIFFWNKLYVPSREHEPKTLWQ